jgi:hypothetical protein
MSDLSLAQNHALDLARTLMVPVTLFEIDGEIGVMPSSFNFPTSFRRRPSCRISPAPSLNIDTSNFLLFVSEG